MSFLSKIKLNGTTYDLRSRYWHSILNSEGAKATPRSNVKFLNVTITDDEENDATVITPIGRTDNAYTPSDAASDTINDTDYIPMLEGTTKKKALWSTIIAKIKTALGLRRKTKVTPTSSGKSTLLAYIKDVVIPLDYGMYSFSAENFSDLPVQNWGFSVIVITEGGGITVIAYKLLSNADYYMRTINFEGTAWQTDWIRVYTTDNKPAWNDISNKPTIPTKTSQLTNDSGYIGSSTPVSYVSTPRSTNGDYNNDLPGANKTKIVEHGTDSPNRPTDNWYYVITMQGGDAQYATQLAYGMTTKRNFVRTYQGGNWQAWNELGTVFKVSSLNANTISEEGIWYVYGSITGAPSTSHGVLWYVKSIGTPFQMYFPDNLPTVYKRWYTNGSWSDWTDLNSTATNRGWAGNNVSWNTMGDGYYGTNPNQIPTELQSLFSSYSYFSSYGTLHLNKGGEAVYPVIEYMDVFGRGARWNSNQNKWTPFRRPTGNATAAQVLSGYTFSNESSDGLVGTFKHTNWATPTGANLNTSSYDLGEQHTFRYVNTSVCYSQGSTHYANNRSGYNSQNGGGELRFDLYDIKPGTTLRLSTSTTVRHDVAVRDGNNNLIGSGYVQSGHDFSFTTASNFSNGTLVVYVRPGSGVSQNMWVWWNVTNSNY